MTAVAFPKPVKRPPRPRKPLKRGKPLARSYMKRGGRKTAHGRRERDFGRMAFYATLPCGLLDALDVVGGFAALMELEGCCGRVEVAHLGARAAYHRCPDSETAPLCRRHHREPGIDGNVGGRAKWYVALGRDGQKALRDELVARAQAAWDALTDEHRLAWDELAAIQRETAKAVAAARRREG